MKRKVFLTATLIIMMIAAGAFAQQFRDTVQAVDLSEVLEELPV